MGSITSGILLSAAMNGADNDRTADLYKMFNDGSGPSQETIQKIEGMIRRKCTVSWDIPGTVVGVNTSSSGIYNGGRYPLLVRQDKTGQVFEYDFDGFKLIEE